MGEFGPTGKMNADVAGVIFMFTDKDETPAENHAAATYWGSAFNNMTYPTASTARGADPVGGLSMVTELFNGHRVDLLWPGSGPLTDPTERAALKDLMRNIKGADNLPWAPSFTLGGAEILPEAFVADDSIDPCSNSQGKRLFGVYCIGGHVASLYFPITSHPTFSGFPASISALKHLRHIFYGGVSALKLVIPCEFGQLASLVAFVLAFAAGNGPIEFPEDDGCMNGLVSLEEVMIGAYKMNRFPTSFLKLPQMQTISLTRAPVAVLPVLLSPKLRVLRLSEVGASGPLPSFRSSALLEVVFLDRNNLELGDAGAFDDCPKLKTVDVSHNSLSTTVFHFAGSTNIESMDFSHNAIHGAVPSQWAELNSCKVVRTSHNLIVVPTQSEMKTLQSMSAVALLDLSHNRIECSRIVNRETNILEMGHWLMALLTPSHSSVDVSYNLLQEPFDLVDETHPYGGKINNAANEALPALSDLILSHNFMWGYIDFGTIHYNMDLSYNNLTKMSVGGAQGPGFTGAKYLRKMYSVNWSNQMSRVDLFPNHGSAWEIQTIDQALNNSALNFKLVEFMPRHDSFEQIELPAGSDRFPFACPTWFVLYLLVVSSFI
jgi:hypothetical protein